MKFEACCQLIEAVIGKKITGWREGMDQRVPVIVADLLASLEDDKAEILRLSFGLEDGSVPCSLREIGRRFSRSPEWARQLKMKVLCYLHHPSRSRILWRELQQEWVLGEEEKDDNKQIQELQMTIACLVRYVDHLQAQIAPIAEKVAQIIHIQENPLQKNLQDMIRIAKLLAMSLSDLEFSTRTTNCLRMLAMQTVEDLTQKTATDLLCHCRNFGRASLREVEDVLAGLGLSLGMEVVPYRQEAIQQMVKRWCDDNVPDAV